MKILYSTDAHLKRTSPASRTDDFFETMLGKEAWVRDFGNEQKVDLFLDGGDLWDVPTQTVYELNRLWEVWEGRRVKTLGVAGNHPIKGNAELWHDRSGLLVMQRQGLIEILDPFKADVECGGLKIRLHHTDLVKKPVLWDHTLWKDYDAGDCKIVLCSHYHPRQGIWRRDDGVVFVSPGALSRGTLGEENLKRIPAVALIEVERGKIVSIDIVDVPCLPGPEVLNSKTIITTKEIEKNNASLDECVMVMRELGASGQTLTIHDILKIVRENVEITDEAYAYVLEKMQEAA